MESRLKSLPRLTRSLSKLALPIIVGLAAMLWWTRPLRSDNFVFYLSSTREVLPIRTISGTDYLPLLRVLNLVGKVDALKEAADNLQVWLGPTRLELRPGSRKILVGQTSLSLTEPVRVIEGQWLVPLDFLARALPRLIPQPITYHTGDRRIFIGSSKPATYSARLTQLPEGARLTLNFTSPVTLQTAARNGKWILYLGDRAVEPLETRLQFQNPYLRELQFDDQDGMPKLILTPNVSGLDLFPAVEEGGRVLRVDVVKQGTTVAQAPQPPEAASPATSAPSETAPPAGPSPPMPGAPITPASNLPVVVVDPGHGGANIGAQGENGVLEKNLVAQLAVRVRTALLASQKYRVILTRVGDTDPGFDERAALADTMRASVFLSLHAGNLGFRSPRVVVYTYEPPQPSDLPPDGPRPLFVPWDKAQDVHLGESKRLAQALQKQFAALPGLASTQVEESPVRALRSVDAPAVAIEIGSLAPNVDPTVLVSTDFQQKIADAIVAAINAFSKGAA